VKIGDTIHTEGEVIDKKGRGEYSGVVTTRNCVKNQRGENVAVWDLRVLIAKRGKGT
jgi:acyl dehydratase